jgi:hypothetical protein
MTIDQAIGGAVNEVNVNREDIKDKAIDAIEKALFENNRTQDQNFINAMQEIKAVRDFLGDPSKILGSQLTKHGEIAEQVEVGIGNAEQLIKGLPKRFTFDGVGRTAPEDYIMDGIRAQSKFINGENNTLSAVIEHLEKYKDINFGRDGSKYVIPKDFYETIKKIINEENVEGLSEKSIRAIKEKVQTIEALTGKDFNDVVDSSISNYNEVQQGVISKTVDNSEKKIYNENSEIKKAMKQDADSKKDTAILKSQPSIQEALKVAAVSAAAEGAIQTAVMMFQKKKPLKDYDVDDWKEVGFVFSKGAGHGAIRGVSIYALTNYAAMPAPLAASFVSASFGVASLYSSYKKGLISTEQMIEQGEILCFDTTLNLLGSSIGQTLIPIPMLGAVIGSIAANVLGGIIKDQLNDREKELIKLSRIRYEENIKLLDEKLSKEIEKIIKQMMFMWGLSRMAFDFKMNASLRFEASQRLAVAHGVAENKILMSEKEIDDYFTS